MFDRWRGEREHETPLPSHMQTDFDIQTVLHTHTPSENTNMIKIMYTPVLPRGIQLTAILAAFNTHSASSTKTANSATRTTGGSDTTVDTTRDTGVVSAPVMVVVVPVVFEDAPVVGVSSVSASDTARYT